MLTIVIPTRNRWAYLQRLLTYFSVSGLTHLILIGDSSDSSQVGNGKQVLDSFSGQLRVKHQLFPGIFTFPCILGLLNQVTTPYAVFAADDDFLIPNSLNDAVAFLEHHPSYIAANGKAVIFGVRADDAHGPITQTWLYPQWSVEHETASRRLTAHLGTYRPIIYAVHRTEALRKSYQAVVDLDLDNSFGELLPSSMPIIAGKVKTLERLYMVRQTHADMTSRKLNSDMFDWISGPRWAMQLEKFRDCLVQEVMRVDSMQLVEAREIVKEALLLHVRKGLAANWEKRYLHREVTAFSRIYRMARDIPALRKTWRDFRSLLPGHGNDEYRASLPSLLRPSSRYHSDFLPIYRAITS
tara:strand:- start:14122 stop:15186 length:1065 start_codon:yes stop_codon:yes gene_type:complete